MALKLLIHVVRAPQMKANIIAIVAIIFTVIISIFIVLSISINYPSHNLVKKNCSSYSDIAYFNKAMLALMITAFFPQLLTYQPFNNIFLNFSLQ